MQANLLRVSGDRCAIVHIPGPGSVIKLYFSDPIKDLPRAMCVTPSNPAKCLIEPGEFRKDGFYNSKMEITFVNRKRPRPVYKAERKM